MLTQQSGPLDPRFGDVLRRVRVAQGLTQEILAERTGLSVRGISDLERGVRSTPRRETILRLIEGLALPGEEQAALWSAARRSPRPRALPGTVRWPLPGSGLVAPDEFIGRAAELNAIVLALHDPHYRLLTLTGPPGVGKTRLALEAVQRLDALVPTEIAFVDLAPIRDPLLVGPTIAAAVGLPEARTDLLDRLRARLEARPALLLLDNFEHLLAATSFVADLLQMSDAVRLLVTSREPLRIDSEYELPVLSLATPRLARGLSVRDVIAHDAVALFVVRAREIDPAFRLTDENARAIAALCVRLDGLPLALELAAARINHIGPTAMVERMAQRRPVLTAGRRDLPDRQRTLADAIDWSYELLSNSERHLLRLCSIFLGGFMQDAVEAIARQMGERNVRDHLASLADKNLLVRHAARSGDVRYAMLETIREYGLERLAAHGEETTVRGAHAAYFLAFAEDAAHDFCAGAGQHAAIARLADEHDNVRQALAWALEQADPESLLRLTGALWQFWTIHGHTNEGQGWLERALARGAHAPPAARARVLIASGRLAWVRGQFATATRRLEQAVALEPDPFDRCEALNALGDVAREGRDYARAEAWLTEAITVGRAHEDWFHLGASLHNLGIVELERGEHERARAALEEGLAFAQMTKSQYLAYSALHYLSRLAFAQADYERAVRLRRDDLAVQRELAPLNAHGAARFCEGIALLAMAQDQPTLAARFFGAAETQREEAEDIEPAERQQIAPWVAAAREALGEAIFTREWDAGRALAVERALAEASVLLDAWGRTRWRDGFSYRPPDS